MPVVDPTATGVHLAWLGPTTPTGLGRGHGCAGAGRPPPRDATRGPAGRRNHIAALDRFEDRGFRCGHRPAQPCPNLPVRAGAGAFPDARGRLRLGQQFLGSDRHPAGGLWPASPCSRRPITCGCAARASWPLCSSSPRPTAGDPGSAVHPPRRHAAHRAAPVGHCRPARLPNPTDPECFGSGGSPE